MTTMKVIDQKQLDELQYLRHFYEEAEFGPAEDDVVAEINRRYTEDTGKEIPEGY